MVQLLHQTLRCNILCTVLAPLESRLWLLPLPLLVSTSIADPAKERGRAGHLRGLRIPPILSRTVLPPGATIAFIMFGLGAVVSERLRMDLSRWPIVARAPLNLAYIAGCIPITLFVVIHVLEEAPARPRRLS